MKWAMYTIIQRNRPFHKLDRTKPPKFQAEKQWQWQCKQNKRFETKVKRIHRSNSICRTIDLSFWYFVIWLLLPSNRKSVDFMAARKNTNELGIVKLWARINRHHHESFWMKTIFFFIYYFFFCSVPQSFQRNATCTHSVLCVYAPWIIFHSCALFSIHGWQFVNEPYHYAYDVRIKWIKIISIFLFVCAELWLARSSNIIVADGLVAGDCHCFNNTFKSSR